MRLNWFSRLPHSTTVSLRRRLSGYGLQPYERHGRKHPYYRHILFTRVCLHAYAIPSHQELTFSSSTLLVDCTKCSFHIPHSLQFKCFAEEDHDVEFPHLLHSVNATQVDIEFVKLTSTPAGPSPLPHIKHPRIAAEFLLVANESNQKSYAVSSRKTLDDEHTPGIFELIDIISPNSLIAAKGSYSPSQNILYLL